LNDPITGLFIAHVGDDGNLVGSEAANEVSRPTQLDTDFSIDHAADFDAGHGIAELQGQIDQPDIAFGLARDGEEENGQEQR